MNRKAGSTELLEMDSITYSKNISIDGFRNDPKSNIIGKHDTVSIFKFDVPLFLRKYIFISV